MDRVEHDLSVEQWIALKEAWSGCAYCGIVGKPLQRDCVLPLSRGGRYTLDNIVPACGSCNTSKCNDEVTGWLRRKRLNEGSFLLRFSQIKAKLAVHLSPGSDRPADLANCGLPGDLCAAAELPIAPVLPRGRR